MTPAADYAVFSLLTGISLAVGLYFSMKKTIIQGSVTDEIFLGSKSLQVLPLGLSVLASVASATGIIGLPAHMYAYGFHISWVVPLNVILLPMAIGVVVPVFYDLKVTSVFQYVRLRYNTVISIMAAITYIILSQMVGAIAIYSSTVAMATIFQIPSTWCSVVIGLAATAYTALGGFRGVVWADCVQGLLALGVPFLVICKVAYDSNNGQFKTWPLSELEPRKYFFDVTVDFSRDETVWAVLIALSPTFLSRICLDQMTVQRYLASQTLQQAKRTILLGTLMMCIFYSLGAAEAMALSCRYRGCDPQILGQITRTDQILPFYVLSNLNALPGLSGIFLAGVVSASISTVSSLVNSQAAVVYMDVVTPFFKVDSASVSPIIKGIAFSAGCVMTALSLAVAHVGSAISVFILANAAICGPFVGLLLLGLTAPFATSKGAGIVTLVMIAYQLGHMLCKLQSGIRDQRMPVSVEYCPDNTTIPENAYNITSSKIASSNDESMFLARLSSGWSSFFSAIVTYIGGLVLSLFIDRNKLSSGVDGRLTSDVLFPVWRRLGLLRPEKNSIFLVVRRDHKKPRWTEIADPSEQVNLTHEASV